MGEWGMIPIILCIFSFGTKKAEGIPRLLRKRRDELALSTILLCLEAVETEDGTTTLRLWTRLEGDLARRATLGAGCREHLALTEALLLSLVATVLAPLWSCETALLIESLFTLGEGKLGTAIAAR
jgi:hypothetical protein